MRDPNIRWRETNEDPSCQSGLDMRVHTCTPTHPHTHRNSTGDRHMGLMGYSVDMV